MELTIRKTVECNSENVKTMQTVVRVVMMLLVLMMMMVMMMHKI